MILVDDPSLLIYLLESRVGPKRWREAEASGEFQRDCTDPSTLHADDGEIDQCDPFGILH